MTARPEDDPQHRPRLRGGGGGGGGGGGEKTQMAITDQSQADDSQPALQRHAGVEQSSSLENALSWMQLHKDVFQTQILNVHFRI